jgi:hypothetical protein
MHSELRAPFEANLGFTPEVPPDMLFMMRPSIPISQDATDRLQRLREVHTLGRSVFMLQNDAVHAH